MAIDPTRLAADFKSYSLPVKDYHQLKSSDKVFSESLSDAVKQLKNNDNFTASAIAQIELAQLQLLQGLFSVDNEIENNDFLFDFGLIAQGQLLALQQSQIADKYSLSSPSVVPQPELPEPKQIAKLIDHVADKISLPPALIHSVVAAESSYNPTAVSPAGAQGLMQLMPATAQDLGVEDSFDPLQNLLGGSRYLKQLLEKYAGDLDYALAAYNWGQGNVDRHGLERMPQETRDYLARVKGLLEKKSV